MKYAHTNVITTDWRRLSRFYQTVFRCTPVPPERDLSGDWLERATAVSEAHMRGVHPRLPGYGETAPSLEVFEYGEVLLPGAPKANRQGFTHIAFEVDDVQAAVQQVLREGGGCVGEIVSREVPGAGVITFAYVTDPDGNIIEVQHWNRNNEYSDTYIPHVAAARL